VLVGGKGGVGKTSTAAAMGIRAADAGMPTLVASTDPAHSLGDALQTDLAGGKAVPVPGCDGLFALEVDPAEAIARFREAVTAFRPSDLGLGGLAEELLDGLGLSAFADILDEPPPGLDELLALAEVVELTSGGPQDVIDVAADDLDDFDARLAARTGASAPPSSRVPYRRVILDTAPTGHTLRLLALPKFLDSLIGKLLGLRRRLGRVLAAAVAVGAVGQGVEAKIDAAAAKLAGWQARVAALKEILVDAETTSFCVVTVPTEVAMAETERLLDSLRDQGISTRHVVVNQVVDASGGPAYLQRLRKGQDATLAKLLGPAAGPDWAGVDVTRVAYFDMELRGVYPLRFFGERAFAGDHWASFLAPPDAGAQGQMVDAGTNNCRFVVVGGKGGVGKTSSAAALALKAADAGHNTLIVSTDPAHSLGDVLGMRLKVSEGTPTAVEEASHRRLWAIEVDPEAAARRFQETVRRLGAEAAATEGGSRGLMDSIAGELGLADFAEVLDTLPPGVDELVALAKVVSLLEEGAMGVRFDRIVIDTAPTGHTLRLLRFPDFLDRFVTRLLRLRQRLSAASSAISGVSAAFGAVLGGGRKAPPKPAAAPDAAGQSSAADTLRTFQRQMRQLSDILHDEKRAEFCVVTIPTELALLESRRLLAALRKDGVAVRHVVLNRLVEPEDEAGARFVERLARGHAKCLARAREMAAARGMAVTAVPFFDTEVTGPPGLRALGTALFRKAG